MPRQRVPGTTRTAGPCVLVVSSDAGVRRQLGAWLEHEGYEVMGCPGPRTPAARCVGLQGDRCALDTGADITVLDLDPIGPDLVDQTTRTALVSLYLARNRSVLVLADELGSGPQPDVDGAAVIPRAAERGLFLATVEELLRHRDTRGNQT